MVVEKRKKKNKVLKNPFNQLYFLSAMLKLNVKKPNIFNLKFCLENAFIGEKIKLWTFIFIALKKQ